MAKPGPSHPTEQDPAFEDQVKTMIDRIKQGLQAHGNDVDLVDIDQDRSVTVRVHKKPGDHEQVSNVLEIGIKDMIKQRLPEVRDVVTV